MSDAKTCETTRRNGFERDSIAPVIRWRNPSSLDIPSEHIVDEARLSGAVVAKHEHKRHLRRLVTARIQFLQWPMHIVVERLDEAGV